MNSFSNRLTLSLSATAVSLEQALYANLNYYSRPDGTQFFALDREPSLDLGATVLHISGLDDYSVRQLDLNENGSGPNGELQGYDFRNAYASCKPSLAGAGQRQCIVAWGGFDPNDITAYLTNNGLHKEDGQPTRVNQITVFPLNGLTGALSTDPNVTKEVTTDIDMALSMAPGLTELVVFEGNLRSDIFSAMATRLPLCNQVSSSVRWGQPPDEVWKNILYQLAAQGQSYFQSSGDHGLWPTGADPGDEREAPNTTVVGETHLYMANNGSQYN